MKNKYSLLWIDDLFDQLKRGQCIFKNRLEIMILLVKDQGVENAKKMHPRLIIDTMSS